jgi:hypothetical protein
MNIFIKKIIYVFIFAVGTLTHVPYVLAAHIYIEAPKTASSNREPLSLSVFLDPENDTVSGVSGNFSFPSALFDIKNITTQNGIIPLWVTQPHVSVEKSFDQRTHITFEGIVPGGFGGVRTPYATGIYPGIVFTVTLIPKGSGSGNFVIENSELHAFDDRGTLIASTGDSQPISVPILTGKEIEKSLVLKPLFNVNTVNVNIATSELVNNNAPYLYVREENSSHAIDRIEVAETSTSNAANVSEREWHVATNPYPLAYTARTKYIHVKIIYTDNTYTIKTVSPVENSQPFLNLSRILVYILVVISLVYFYGKNFLHFFKKITT